MTLKVGDFVQWLNASNSYGYIVRIYDEFKEGVHPTVDYTEQWCADINFNNDICYGILLESLKKVNFN